MIEYNSTICSHGFYGGIFWRSHIFAKAGDKHRGHRHHIDHATLISQGGVLCEIAGQEPREYWAPAVIEIDKDLHHQFTALADNTVYFCVFATDSIEKTLGREPDFNQLKSLLCADCTGCTT